MANTGVCQNGPLMLLATIVDGLVEGRKLMAGLVGRVEAIGLPALHLCYGTTKYTVSVPLMLFKLGLS